jgi:hypothetical protein
MELIDSIRKKIMVRFEQKRKIIRSWKGLLVFKVADSIKLISQVLFLTSFQFFLDKRVIIFLTSF